MKIRMGFVSNSSSSSFVLIGNEVKLEDIDLKKGKYMAIGNAELNEGGDIFELNEELLEEIKKREIANKFQFLRTYYHSTENWGGDGEIIKPEQLPKGGAQIFIGSQDQNSTGSVAELVEYYVDRKEK